MTHCTLLDDSIHLKKNFYFISFYLFNYIFQSHNEEGQFCVRCYGCQAKQGQIWQSISLCSQSCLILLKDWKKLKFILFQLMDMICCYQYVCNLDCSFYCFLINLCLIYWFILRCVKSFAILFGSFFKLQQKQPSIQSRGHCLTPSEATFLPVLWSHPDTSSCFSSQRTLSLKLPPSLGCWTI